MKHILPRALLGVSGLMLLAIGLSVLFNPVTFAATNGFELPAAPSALSEFRAPGGVLVVSAIVILLSLVHRHRLQLGLMLAALIYGSYGVARLVSIWLDGLPSKALTQATFVELLVGSICLLMVYWLERAGTDLAHDR